MTAAWATQSKKQLRGQLRKQLRKQSREPSRKQSHLGDAIKEADDAGTPTRHAELPMGWVDARGSAHRDA
jgi:hypothetical protein